MFARPSGLIVRRALARATGDRPVKAFVPANLPNVANETNSNPEALQESGQFNASSR